MANAWMVRAERSGRCMMLVGAERRYRRPSGWCAGGLHNRGTLLTKGLEPLIPLKRHMDSELTVIKSRSNCRRIRIKDILNG